MTDLDERVDQTHRAIRDAFERHRYWISSDGLERVGERDIETAFSWYEGKLRDLRRNGFGPRAYFGGGGHKVTYRLRDLAAWIEEESEKLAAKAG
jgi:hypothetical protein